MMDIFDSMINASEECLEIVQNKFRFAVFELHEF